ncbi:ketopantoate hydroxymethyltransferase [Longirhabdus pacifica]|uniref:ketopantoate hydroxymethyltransferase n=1 Tax=Longirhabdus pacifica TaxID=2305227 RepID=UPI0010091852|nr:ketopantoate hydroxymethyltransferase [Longirhabdus pacifica]
MISATLLHDVANYVDGRAAKVVLNDSYEITDFEVKQVTDGMLAMNYIVPAADVSSITQIDLKDDADNVLSSNAVNVEIAADTLLLHTLLMKEVT